jgi:hypothetical protein
MKKLIIALSLFAAATASAQTARPFKAQAVTQAADPNAAVYATKAQKNLDDLTAVVTLTNERKAVMRELFTTKYRMQNGGGTELSADRKEAIARIIEMKLQASLDAQQFETVKSNAVLFQSLTH